MKSENKYPNKDKELDNVIIPQRYIPFDLGKKISAECEEQLNQYFITNSFEVLEIPGLLKSVSLDVLFKVKISVSMRLYIYSYGIGVFMIEDDLYRMSEKYAVEYCEYRKSAHKDLLEFNRAILSGQIQNIISELRRIVKGKTKKIRSSADEGWEYNGLSYVMTVSYIIKKDKERKDYERLTELEKKNLQIMLQPSIAHMEDTMATTEEEHSIGFDPYNFEVERIEAPRNWMRTEDCAVYISWAAVVVYLRGLLGKYMEIIEYLEVDLQAMWLYTYCQYINLKEWSSLKRLTSAQLKKEKYNFQRKYNEFISENDSSVPVYIMEIRGELIKTSGIDEEKKNYLEYINFCIDEAESYEGEQQRKYSVMNEVLLFIIAFIQIAPMLYNAMVGNYKDLRIEPIVFMITIVIIVVFFIIKKIGDRIT